MFYKSLKKLILCCSVSLILTTFSYGEIVKDIKVNGNSRVSIETIQLFTGVKIGDDLSLNDLNNILKDLYETKFFKDIDLRLNGSILEINVTENPIIQNLIVKNIKHQTLEKVIIENFSIKEKSPYIESEIILAVKNTKDLLKEAGFYFSNVEILTKNNENNTVDLIFDIDLGKKAFIDEIVFSGDKKFKKRKLLNVITSEEDKFWKFISSKRLLNQKRIALDKRLLTNFYKNQGYYNIKIQDETVQYNNDENFNIIFNIESGEKFFFKNFKVTLPEDYDEKYFEKITKRLNKFSQTKYSLRVVEKMLKEIENIASDNQYEFIDAKIIEQIVEKNKINVEIEILDEISKVYVNKIDIQGNNITIEDVIRNQLIVDEGDPLNRILYKKSINNIKSTNIFKTVNAEIIDTQNEFLKDIKITVEEKPTGQISAGAGVGTSGASTAFGVQENNFLGKGIKLNSNIALSEETIKGLFSYTKPNFKNTDRDLILSVQSQETDRLDDYGYKTSDTGFLIGTKFEHLEDFFIQPNISVNYETLETSSSASSLLKKQEGDYFDGSASYALTYDKRDQLFQPSDGFISTFYQKIPLVLEENQTIINSYEITNYIEYVDDLVASFSFFTKAANSLGDDDVRISNRLYLPSRKLRGFESGKIGPVDGGDFIGGNYLAAFNATTNLPVFENLETVDFSLFYDAANVWGVDYDSSMDDSSAIRSSVGLGIDWYTPIGPMSFSFTQPISKKSTDKTESFRFNLGTTF